MRANAQFAPNRLTADTATDPRQDLLFVYARMNVAMLGGSDDLKVFDAVVVANLVLVVNDFIAAQKPAEVSFHDKSVLVDVALARGMPRQIKLDIATRVNSVFASNDACDSSHVKATHG